MSIQSFGLERIAAASLPVAPAGKCKSIPAALTAIHSETAAAAAPLQGRISQSIRQFKEFLTIIPSHIKNYPHLSKNILLKCFQLHKASGASDSLLETTLRPCLKEFACRFGLEDNQFEKCEQFLKEAIQDAEAPKECIQIDTNIKLHHCLLETIKNFEILCGADASILDKFENFRSIVIHFQQALTHRLTYEFYPSHTITKLKNWLERMESLLGMKREGKLALDEAHFNTIMAAHFIDLLNFFFPQSECTNIINGFLPLLHELERSMHHP